MTQVHVPQDFFAKLATAAHRALLLDYDGTLAPFRIERDLATPFPGVRDVLMAMQLAGHTRLVIISGRRACELPALLGLERQPEIWGTHGWERLGSDGSYTAPQLQACACAGLAAARNWAEQRGLGQQIEEKPASLALHWRGLPADTIAEIHASALAHFAQLAPAADLELSTFDGGLELRAPGRDKGFAARAILSELGENAAIAYLGDDLTDEDAFAALDGRGLSVLVRAELRPSKARIWLRPPEELLAFLWQWHRVCLDR
jgi:trehalose-phosphatase